MYPPGYIYNNFNLFMDFFNTYFLEFGEVYEEWGSIYLPFSFLLVDFISIFVQTEEWELLSASTQIDVEMKSWEFRHTLLNQNMLVVPTLALSLAVITTFLIRQEHVDLGNNWKVYFLIFIITSKPFLFALERGNLILFCLPIVTLLTHYKNSYAKALCITLLASVKIYFIVLILLWKSPRHWLGYGSLVIGLLVLVNGMVDYYLGFKSQSD